MKKTDSATIYDFAVTALDGEEIDLHQYAGQVVMIVNTASHCGFTPQYKGLEEVYQQYRDKGVVILGFPCNQFGAQEPGSSAEIGAFCEKNFGVTFPLSQKVDVNGDQADPLFNYLKKAAPGLLGSKSIKWNFTKFLIKKDGTAFSRYAPATTPEEIIVDIDKLLAE